MQRSATPVRCLAEVFAWGGHALRPAVATSRTPAPSASCGSVVGQAFAVAPSRSQRREADLTNGSTADDDAIDPDRADLLVDPESPSCCASETVG